MSGAAVEGARAGPQRPFCAAARVSPRPAPAGTPYDHIIVESSGVAEPRLLRAMFQEAAAMDWPLMRCLQLKNMVTVVDASGFLREYESSERIADRPDLLGPEAEDSSIALAPGGAEEMGVVQLLVEQVETADVILLNKADLCTESDLAK